MRIKLVCYKHKWVVLVIVIHMIALISSCGYDAYNEIDPNPQILEFLPDTVDSYNGDAGYQHVVNQIEPIDDSNGLGVKLLGEVKNVSAPGKYENHAFTIELLVDDEKMLQTYSGKRLNESEFLKLVLIKLPLEVGNTWKFNSETRWGNSVSVVGEIIEFDETEGFVKVRHSLKSGYYEERTLFKSHGVTDFIRLVTFKNETAITGYHSDWRYTETPTDEVDVAMAYPKQVVIPDHLYNLLLGFNQSWSAYILEEDDAILSFVEEGSEAYKKIMSVDRELSSDITFLKYYPYAIEREDNTATIWAFERFENQEGQTLENKVKYHVINVNQIPKISNFEIIK